MVCHVVHLCEWLTLIQLSSGEIMGKIKQIKKTKKKQKQKQKKQKTKKKQKKQKNKKTKEKENKKENKRQVVWCVRVRAREERKQFFFLFFASL